MGIFVKLLSFLPMILHAVYSVEQARKGATGAEKKSAVMDVVNDGIAVIAGSVPGAAGVVGKIAPHVGTIVDGTVGILNATGVFTTSGPKDPAPGAQVVEISQAAATVAAGAGEIVSALGHETAGDVTGAVAGVVADGVKTIADVLAKHEGQ